MSRRWPAVVLDFGALVVFVALGKREHATGAGVPAFLQTLLPFVAGWFGAAWAVHLYRDPLDWRRLAITWAVGVPAALVLRSLMEWQSPVSLFAVVGPLFLGAFVLGWRLVTRLFGALSSRGVGDVRPAER